MYKRDDKLFFKIIYFGVCNLSRRDGLSIDAKLPLFAFVCKYFVASGVTNSVRITRV